MDVSIIPPPGTDRDTLFLLLGRTVVDALLLLRGFRGIEGVL